MSATIRRRAFLAAGATLLALAAGAATAISVSTNYLPETDFSGIKTYRWVLIEGVPALDNITDTQIKQAADKQFAAKGWTRSESAEADAYVAYQLSIEQRRRLNYYGGGYGYGYGWRWGGGGPGHATETVTDIGTLTLDVYDPKNKALIWRGTASDSVRKKASPEKRQQRLDKAMAKLLKEFPPAK